MVKRERYMEQIRPFIGSEPVKVLTGMRRSGKSVMLDLIKDELRKSGILEEQIISFNFESFSNAKFCTANALYEELRTRIAKTEKKIFLFFDEIQEVEHWEKCINSARVDFDCDIYITGSNAKLLSGELATYLGGRYVEFEIYPFSFDEYIESLKLSNGQLSTPEAFRSYLEFGGMPFLSNLRGEKTASIQCLRDVYNSVILKDVVKRANIRDVDLLERIITYVMANIGHPFSARSVSNYFKNENRKAAVETVLNYIRACSDAFLFSKLQRESLPEKKILSVNEKYYVVDHGLRDAVYGNNGRDIDQILENIIYTELRRRRYNITSGEISGKEVDFIAEKNGKQIYIQVTYLLASPETIQREFTPLELIRDNFPKYVVSMDEINMSRDGIIHSNIRDFLLRDNWD